MKGGAVPALHIQPSGTRFPRRELMLIVSWQLVTLGSPEGSVSAHRWARSPWLPAVTCFTRGRTCPCTKDRRSRDQVRKGNAERAVEVWTAVYGVACASPGAGRTTWSGGDGGPANEA